jgi:hypothetical protein
MKCTVKLRIEAGGIAGGEYNSVFASLGIFA